MGNISLKQFGSILLWLGLAFILLGPLTMCLGFSGFIGSAMEGADAPSGIGPMMGGMLMTLLAIILLIAGAIIKAVGNATERRSRREAED